MPQPKLLDLVRYTVRARHLSHRTEDAYAHFIKRFILFHNKRHPKEMGAEEVRQNLSYSAVECNVAASTQNIALNALLFLYKNVLEIPLPFIDGVVRAKVTRRLHVLFTWAEVKAILDQMSGTYRLIDSLLYGAGLLAALPRTVSKTAPTFARFRSCRGTKN